MAFTRHEKDGIIYYTSDLFDAHGIPHFFASSRGGVSTGDFDSLNISTSRKDRNGNPDILQNVRSNLQIGLGIIGKSENTCCMMKQVHSAGVAKAQVPCSDYFDGVSECQPCDGIFCASGDNVDTLCVKTADCVPVLLYDLKNNVACALHAGWRGTVGDICGCAVRTLMQQYGDVDIIAAIGPCIHECCYEVNDKVWDVAVYAATRSGISLSEVEKCFPRRYIANGENKYRVSLPALNRMFLENAGVPRKNISVCELCTCCASDGDGNSIFFSHRASGGFSGTQMSVVAVKKQG